MIIKKFWFYLIASFLLVSCGPGQFIGPTLTLKPTLASTPTYTPTSTPTDTPTLTATPVPNGPCDNPLLPLRKGNQWIYRVTTSSGESQFSIASLDIQNGANFVAQVEYIDQKNNLTITKSVICEDGAIVNFPLFVMNMLFSPYLDKYISVTHLSSDYAPNYQSLIQDNWVLNWQAGYLTENSAYIRNPSGQADLYIPYNTQIDLSFILNGLRDPIIVPAGSFTQTLKITQDVSLPVTLTTLGSESGTGDSLKISMTQWYEPYIGLVRANVTSAYLNGALNLPIESVLELVAFISGK
jgi:hypothetical protein